MTPEDILWHIECDCARLEAMPPRTASERLELRRIIERLQGVLTEELEGVA
jgi:hypothetical protein